MATKLTDKQIKDLEWLQNLILGGEIPYTDPDGDPYLMCGDDANTEYIKKDFEQSVEDALAREEAEYPDEWDEVIEYLKAEGF